MTGSKLSEWMKTTASRMRSRRSANFIPSNTLPPSHPVNDGQMSGIVASHTTSPRRAFPCFSTFGALMSPDLPLQRHQHEMIATMVSVTNHCHY